jgi:hypothetical protein
MVSRTSFLALTILSAVPFGFSACDFGKKSDSAGATPSSTAPTSTAATATGTVTAPDTTQPLAVGPSGSPNRPGPVQPVRLPDGGLVGPDGAAWTIPSNLVLPSVLPPMPSSFPAIPSGFGPLPSGLPIPHPTSSR